MEMSERNLLYGSETLQHLLHKADPSRADILLATLAPALSGPLAEPIRAFGGRRLLLATDVPGYQVVGAA
jgi:hypothetical protein